MTPRIQALLPSPGAAPSNHVAIVVFPHAGGSPRAYRSWSGLLPAGIDLYGVTYPGRDQLLNEPVPETFGELVSGCAAELEPLVRSLRSVVIFGHSMGAYVATEATRSLERIGVQVAALVVSGADAPHLESQRGDRRDWHLASDDDLTAHVGEMDVRSREVLAIPELRDMFLPIIRDDYRLIENYRSGPDPRLSCPLHVLFGESDPEVSATHSASWASYTRAESKVRSFPGDHFYLTSDPAPVVAYLAGVLS